MEENDVYQCSLEPTGTHALLLAEIKQGTRVLDVGCASGYLGGFLIREKDCEVWGIEPDTARAAKAKEEGYQEVATDTVEATIEQHLLPDQQYDYILIGDVLEHLVDAGAVLDQLVPLLKDDGKMIVSLPNIAHYSTRFALLRGKWEYTDSGIMDRTHLYFYTRKSARALLESHGLTVERIRPRGDVERWFGKVGLGFLGKAMLHACPGFFAVQNILIAKKK